MNRLKKILFVMDEHTASRALFKKAIQMAKANEAHLGVVTVESKPPFEFKLLKPSISFQRIEKLLVEDRFKRMDAFLNPAINQGISVGKKVLQGTPFIEIIREILRENYDLVMTGAKRKDGIKEMFFGSNVMHLLRKCPCPVWAINKKQKGRLKYILAAVDPVAEDEPDGKIRDKLNYKIMDWATHLAIQEKSQLHVVHVWSLFGEDFMRYRAKLPNEEVDRLNEGTKKLHQEWVHNLLNSYRDKIPNIQLHFLKGNPWIVIPEFLKKGEFNLLVMGTVARSGISGLLMGNTAEKILNRVKCSVLAVKPEGFVSPVKLES